MTSYQYKAVNQEGKEIKGFYTAIDREEVLNMLRQNQHYPISVQKIVERKNIIKFNFFSKIKTKDIAIFCRQFYTMLHAGVTVINCLDTLKLQTENKRFCNVIKEIYEEVQQGFTFAEALKKRIKYLPYLLINMVEVGEVSGNLDVIMDQMAVYYEKENKIANKIKGAMIYPIVLSIVAIFVVMFLLAFVMPTFVNMFESSGVELPFSTKILLMFSKHIKQYWYVVTLGLLLLAYGIKPYVGKSYAGSKKAQFLFDYIKLHGPVVKSITQKIITSRFTRTLSILLSSGIPLIQALDITSRIVDNVVAEKKILEVKKEVRKGMDLTVPISKISVFPPMVISMIHIGEEFGILDEILDKTANFYDDDLETALHKVTTLLEPLMIVIMSIVVGIIVVAMLLPMFDMINIIQY